MTMFILSLFVSSSPYYQAIETGLLQRQAGGPCQAQVISHTDAIRAFHAFLPHNRPLTSICHWLLAFVLKEPIHCYLHVDTSVICHVLMHCLGSLLVKQ